MPRPTIKSMQRHIDSLNSALETALAVAPIRDDNFFPKGLSESYADRNAWDRKKIFAETLRAWRVNPIARRIVHLTRAFVLGKSGVTLKASNARAQAFLTAWWQDPLNQFSQKSKKWVDEGIRTGNLFFLVSVQPNGMSHWRAVPAEQICEIVTAENDIEQEIRYTKDETGSDYYEAYNPNAAQAQFMLHYAFNQPVGATWGEADLTTVLAWVGRFSSWLEDRVRLNHFRSVFMYIVQGQFKSAEEKKARQLEINSNPPKPGTVLVTDPSEQWGIMSANLDSFDASVDGLAIKRMIASGIGMPMHWLAEPEGSTRTTAEAAGTPAFRTLEEQQAEYFEMFADMARVALKLKGIRAVNVWIEGNDITEKDNAALALALGRAYPNLADLYDRNAIEAKEFMRLVYKTFAEVYEEDTPPAILKRPIESPAAQSASSAAGIPAPTTPAPIKGKDKSDPQTEEAE